MLGCTVCSRRFAIRRRIPRFIDDDNYASSFGFEWSRHAKTQIDKFNGTDISRDRFFGETGWPEDLIGEKILEVGCGAGRFTEIAIRTGAEVWSFDLSSAVDAALENIGMTDRHHLFQADISALPFLHGFFDKIFCFGVLQHTADPRGSFLGLIRYLKVGGEIVIDTYNRNSLGAFFHPKYYLRPLTTRMDSRKLYELVSRAVPLLLPVSRVLRRIPVIGKPLSLVLPVANYQDLLPIKDEDVLDWALLDTFDWLSPRYDFPQTPGRVADWFDEAKLVNTRIESGGIIVASGTRTSNRDA